MPNKYKADISLSYLREALDYCPKSGKLYWKASRPSSHFSRHSTYLLYLTRFAGNEAGGIRKGRKTEYKSVFICNSHYKAHRLAYALVKQCWPDGDIDHLDGNGLNNRISNLRVVSNTENAKNTRAHENNVSGITGVHWDVRKKRWIAQGNIGGKRTQIASSKNKDEVIKARQLFEEEHGYSARHGES